MHTPSSLYLNPVPSIPEETDETILLPSEIAFLKSGNPETIIDIRISINGSQEADLARNGYFQIPSDQPGGVGGTFGKGKSLWIWRKKQGTCGGRLKPIIDIQLLNISSSSAMVVSGYSCITEPLGSQYLWIKRAVTEEDADDAILDFRVTLGKSKILTDNIWSSPGVGWLRIDGNFSTAGMMDFNKLDAFLWYLPSRSRSPESAAASPIRHVSSISDDLKREKILFYIRRAIRFHVPVHEMKRLTDSENILIMNEELPPPAGHYQGPVILYNRVGALINSYSCNNVFLYFYIAIAIIFLVIIF